MSVFKTTFSRALNIYPSEFSNIPYPNLITSATNSTAASSTVTDVTATFITDNVKTGDIVISIGDGLSATVVDVISETQLELNSIVGGTCKIYQASSQTGIGNQGCYIYNTIADNNLDVVTIGGDEVSFQAIPAGTLLPIQVLKVVSGDGPLVALW